MKWSAWCLIAFQLASSCPAWTTTNSQRQPTTRSSGYSDDSALLFLYKYQRGSQHDRAIGLFSQRNPEFEGSSQEDDEPSISSPRELLNEIKNTAQAPKRSKGSSSLVQSPSSDPQSNLDRNDNNLISNSALLREEQLMSELKTADDDESSSSSADRILRELFGDSTVEMAQALSPDDEDDNSDAVFLDEESYMNFRNFLNIDGSLNLQQGNGKNRKNGGKAAAPSQFRSQIFGSLLNNPEIAEEYSNTNTKHTDLTMEDVIATVNAASNNQLDAEARNASSEALYHQIFAQESGYLNQSDLFKQAMTNKTAAAEASALRRSARYRKEQEKEMQKLDAQIQEMEALLRNNSRTR